jgi:hypothetical protein
LGTHTPRVSSDITSFTTSTSKPKCLFGSWEGKGGSGRGERVKERVEKERIAPTLHGVYLGELKKESGEDFKIFFLIILETKKVLVIILLISPPKTLSQTR